MYADEKMKEEFYDWLDDCPVQWRRGEVNQDSISYTFICDDDEDNTDKRTAKYYLVSRLSWCSCRPFRI